MKVSNALIGSHGNEGKPCSQTKHTVLEPNVVLPKLIDHWQVSFVSTLHMIDMVVKPWHLNLHPVSHGYLSTLVLPKLIDNWQVSFVSTIHMIDMVVKPGHLNLHPVPHGYLLNSRKLDSYPPTSNKNKNLSLKAVQRIQISWSQIQPFLQGRTF